MPGILWGSIEEKEGEWLFAKERLNPQGELCKNGTKLRRKDHSNTLNHSFMVMDNRIIALSGKGLYLGKGLNGHAKLAEDEAGNLIALKIIPNVDNRSSSVKESKIARDLGIAGQLFERTKTSKKITIKQYIAYQYLGTQLAEFLRNKPLSLDKCYELCIKISLALYEIHTGKKTKSTKSYQHNDIHKENLVIDEKGEPHFIDYGRARKADCQNADDIVRMLLLFFIPTADRNYLRNSWIFGSWMGEYEFVYHKPRFDKELQQYTGKGSTVYLYVDRCDRIEDDFLTKVRYMVKDSEHVFQTGEVDLCELELTQFPRVNESEIFWYSELSLSDTSLIENKVLEVANQNNHTINRKHRNETLFNLLKDPTEFYKAPEIPTALDIAETLTLCRLQLESYQNALAAHSQDVRLEIMQILNSMSSGLLGLYEQLRILPGKDSLDKLVKSYIFSRLLSSIEEPAEESLRFLNLQLDETQTIKQYVDNLFIMTLHESAESIAQNTIPKENTRSGLGVGSTAALTSGVGFFVSKDAGLAETVSKVKMGRGYASV